MASIIVHALFTAALLIVCSGVDSDTCQEPGALCARPGSADLKDETSSGIGLLQVKGDMQRVNSQDGDAASLLNVRKALSAPAASRGGSAPTCVDLNNHGTHFTVDIEVGTPGQKFSVVADTGSNSLIVPSCVCQQRRFCSSSDRCFTGTNRSTSFSLKDGPKGYQSVFITFGSGTIEAIVAKEKVTVGHLGVDMKEGILLMVSRHLNIVGKFEGILGLGLPNKGPQKKHKKDHSHGSAGSNPVKDLVKKILGGIGDNIWADGGNAATPQATSALHLPAPERGPVPEEAVLEVPVPSEAQLSEEVHRELDDIGDIIQVIDRDANNARMAHAARMPMSQHRALAHDAGHGHSWRHEKDPEVVGPKGLLEQAGISRFSMCFNDGASGVLNLDIPEMPESLSSVGKFHWGLDFRGISIGDTVAPLSFCSAENMTNGQETPCGAIPDSGTTVIMAPKEHLSVLLDSICDEWPRCAQNYSAMVKAAEAAKQGATAMYTWDPFEITPAAKSSVLQLMLLDCASWMNESSGLSELPSLKFHIESGKGDRKTLELPGWAYVLETTHDDAEENQQLQGMDGDVVFLQNKNSTVSKRKVCSPAFGAMDYNTQKNGPVWILGTPFFYQFHVGYDLNSSPPAISFTSTETTPCVSCGGQAVLLDTKAKARHPRFVSGPLRIPDMDTSLPL